MKARVHEHKHFWWAWSFVSDWPRRVARVYLKRNEYDQDVWHMGVILLGYSAELRWGFR